MAENPFGETPNLRFFHLAPSHAIALQRVLGIFEREKGFALINGEVGTGKTLVSRVLLKILESEAINTALIVQPVLNKRELLAQINDEFGVTRPESEFAPREMGEELRRLNDFALRNAESGRRNVIIIDEAHRLPIEALETVRLLANLETSSQKLVHVVLFAQPELLEKLRAYEMRQLSSRITVRATLNPLTCHETEAYLRHRLEAAGGGNFIRFNEGAVKALHAMSDGIPRMVNFFAELTLLAAERREVRFIDQSVVRAACSRQDVSPGKWRLRDLFDPSWWSA